MSPEREFDPRAIARGVTVETPILAVGTRYWYAYEIRWYNEREADGLGPDHHIMIDAEWQGGDRAVGTEARVSWPDGIVNTPIEAKPGEPYGGNFPMTPGKYDVRMWANEPSEVVKGIEMGEMTPNGFNPGIHTTTGVRYRLEIMRDGDPDPGPTPEPEPEPDPNAVYIEVLIDGGLYAGWLPLKGVG